MEYFREKLHVNHMWELKSSFHFSETSDEIK